LVILQLEQRKALVIVPIWAGGHQLYDHLSIICSSSSNSGVLS
jgi:hypothetical protein